MLTTTSAEHVLVISPETHHREKIAATVRKCGLNPVSCDDFARARALLVRQRFSVVFCHDTLPDGNFRSVVTAVKPTPVVVLSRFAEWDAYLAALHAGAFDYIACPPDSAETERIMRSAVRDSASVLRQEAAATKDRASSARS